ncbi:hypothetical protein [Pontibacter chinhatensis]|uniref:Uncharacterized protein n=1 Tax=Pontibacter chinhatensis TaxID=1436961 RepID=A0A1I2R4I4_9BACT|nr:hypothetical protein [Pontibacter chinhatensis]SFG35614.1 hypothetical protein SAMN05421739_102267 [Pontibacter chinhatensis]
MPSQQASNINDFAFDYLRSHYTARFGAKLVLVDKDEQTRQGHAAQGLFSLKKQDNTPFIASLHTLNSPRIATALTKYKKSGLSKLRFATSFFVALLVLAVGWRLGYTVAGAILAVVLSGATFVLHTYLEQKLRIHRLLHLLDDLKKTPADEQWLGLSISSMTLRHNPLAKHFLAACERRGIGIITVGQRAKVVLIKEPKPAVCRRGDFLSHYQADGRIRKALLGDSVLRVA